LALAIIVAAGLSCLSCGAVEFVPSPFTPQNVDLIYSPQEDITIVRWKVSSQAPGQDLKFQILLDNGYEDVDFSRSVYPGGASSCTDGSGTCYQYVLRGQYPVQVRNRPIQGDHDVYGILPGPLVTQLDTAVGPTLQVAASTFLPNDQAVGVQMTDRVASAPPYSYPRSYTRTMWPTEGVCVAPAPPDGVTFTPLDPSGTFPPDLPLTTDGTYCVGIRPLPSDGGDAALAQARVATVPIVTDLQQTYSPPVELSPIVYQIVLDLDIPIADRCAGARSKIEMTVDDAMNDPLTIGNTTMKPIKLMTQNIAYDSSVTDASAYCTQQNTPVLPDAASMAQQVFQQISAYPQRFQQVHLFFFSNLNSPLPPTVNTWLNSFLMDLGSPPPGYALDLYAYLFNQGPAALPTPGAPKPNWTMVVPWQDAADPSYGPMLTKYADQSLPYESQPHDASVPVPLLSPDDAAANDGNWIKICDSTLPVTPVNTNPVVEFPGVPAWQIVGLNPPGYLVSFPGNNRVAYQSFVANTIALDYQICSAYCTGHGFTPMSGAAAMKDWSTSSACAATPVTP
jgi:hypothetical protein